MGTVDLAYTEKALREKQEYTQLFSEYVAELRRRSNPDKLRDFAEFRKFPLSTLEECGIFYIGEMVEMLLPLYLSQVESFGVISPTNHKPIFHDRYLMPIYDQDGSLLNLVGYSSNADERYVYGKAKYYRRKDTLWGLENLPLAYEMGYAVLTEGITDAIRLRSLGIKNAFGRCGTLQSKFVMDQLNRCRYGVIMIPDRDSPGFDTRKHWRTNRSMFLNTYLAYKDSDEMLREPDNVEWFMQYFNEAVKRITAQEHRGIKYNIPDITIF